MKVKKISYWISTGLVCAMMAMSAVMYLTHNPQMMASFATLGYPPYFPNILGVAKLSGIVALLAPGYRLLKEWAYAGFTFTFIGAFVSHLTMGEGAHAVAPLVALALLSASYFTRPPECRVMGAEFADGSAASGWRGAQAREAL